MRLPQDLIQRVDDYARGNNWQEYQGKLNLGGTKDYPGRTALVQNLLEALVQGRIMITPKAGANAFPADEREAGLSPDFPALIDFPTPEPEPAKGFIDSIEGVGIYNNPPPGHFSVSSDPPPPIKETKS